MKIAVLIERKVETLHYTVYPIDNLIVVGRCISGTHLALSSYRVMNIAMAIGQAGGVAAAVACKQKLSPRRMPYKNVQKSLMNMGVDLFD